MKIIIQTVVMVVSFIFFTKINAAEITTTVSTGAQYNSNITAVSDDVSELSSGYQKIRAIELLFDANIYALFDDYITLEYSLFNTTVPYSPDLGTSQNTSDPLSYSLLSHALDVSILHEYDNFDLTWGTWILHAMEDFTDFSNKYISFNSYVDIFYYQTRYSAGYYMLGGSYYQTLNTDTLDYLLGPGFSAEIGQYIFPTATRDYIFFSIGNKTLLFKNYPIYELVTQSGGEETLQVGDITNESTEFYSRLKGKIYIKKTALSLSFYYRYIYFLKNHTYSPSVGTASTKRRIDHRFKIRPKITYPFNKTFSASLQYSYQKNISNMDDDLSPFADWNYDQHVIQGKLSAEF